MKIELRQIKVRDLVKGYRNDEENGASAYDGKLNIRPAYQREFVYKDAQRDKVIETVRKGFPLNVMYWVVNTENTLKNNDTILDAGLSSADEDFFEFEVLDGQQRTISICEFVSGQFSILDKDGANKYFHNLTKDQQEKINEYSLMIYFCEGADSEKLEWFKTINIAGEKLTDQELLNAVYTGPWLTNAKKRFSKSNCPAYVIGGKYLNGVSIKQDYLETVLKWISNDDVSKYMAEHQKDENADELWTFFKNTIDWVNLKFPNYRKEMKGLPWGIFYSKYKDAKIDAGVLEKRIVALMADSEVTKKSGIYEYLLTGKESCLNVRVFDDNIKREAFEAQKGICANNACKKKCKDISEMEADHIKPWSKGGKSTRDNCQMLCKKCNGLKSNN